MATDIEEQVKTDIIDLLQESFMDVNGDFYYLVDGEDYGDFEAWVVGDELVLRDVETNEVWKKFKITVEETTE